jgi:nucleoside-diphosphate-sugar epimerase
MKIFITGANGFIGDRLAGRLAAAGHEIHALIRHPVAGSQPHQNIRYFVGDITQPATLQSAIADCDQVYHIAGYARLWAARRRTFFDINVTGTENVLKAALDCGVKKVVYTSSCAVFGPSYQTPISESDPRISAFSNDYDLSKYLAEKVVIDYCSKGLDAVIVNPSRVYGPGKATHANMITQMLMRCLNHQFVLMPGISHVIGNYAYVDDVVRGHINAMKYGEAGERYIVGGENLSYAQVISIIREELENTRLVPLPAAAVKAWGYVELLKYRLTGRQPKFTPMAARRYLQNAAFDCSKAITAIDYSITGFRQGIVHTLDHLKASL